MSELKTFIPNKIFIFAFVWVFILPLVYYFFQVGEDKYLEYKDKKSLSFIKSIHLDEATIAGTNIPPTPNEVANNATLLGVDANKNYIRDDVELAIYAKYASSTQERVALLGYAQALEMRYRVSWKEGHQYVEDVIDSYEMCLFEDLNLYNEGKTEEAKLQNDQRTKKIEKYFEIINNSFIFNTPLRKKYLSSYNKADAQLIISAHSVSCPLDFNKIK